MSEGLRLRRGPPRMAPAAPGGGRPIAVPDKPAVSTYAALDLGTNNCRLLIARPHGAGFRVIDSFSRIVRLGEGISATGRISEAAIDRTIAALAICRSKIDLRNANRLRLVATEACRQAANGEVFCARVVREAGIRLEVINRENEATLAMIGCTPLVDDEARGAILFDIGGGSTEVVRIERGADGRLRMRAWTSLPFGVVTLAECFGGREVSQQVYARMEAEVARHLAPFVARHGDALDGLHLIGTSGTVTTIAGIHLNLPRYDRRRVDGLWMENAEISATVGRLLGMSYAERADSHCIRRERADLVLPGCAILDAIRHAFPLPRLRIADRGLREGMLVEMMREDGALAAT
ncbi:MAG: exopolyphosphatase [Proteobacteria bacterium]|nr:MAG: exopolyphosphatase [Pseudomonadota bacterium]